MTDYECEAMVPHVCQGQGRIVAYVPVVGKRRSYLMSEIRCLECHIAIRQSEEEERRSYAELYVN